MAASMPKTADNAPLAAFEVDLDGINTRHLPVLTEKQFAFVQLMARGHPITRAYSIVYEDGSTQSKWTGSKAFRLSYNPKIAKWLTAIRSHQVRNIAVNLEEHLRELYNIRELAKEEGKLHTALQAERLRGKASGLYDTTSTVLMGDVNELYRQITEHTKDNNPLAVTIEGQSMEVPAGAHTDSSAQEAKSPLAVDFNPQELASLEQEAAEKGLKVNDLEYDDEGELEEVLGFKGPQAGD